MEDALPLRHEVVQRRRHAVGGVEHLDTIELGSGVAGQRLPSGHGRVDGVGQSV